MASRRDLLEFDILSGSSFVNVVKWEPNQVDNHAKRCYTKAIRRPAWWTYSSVSSQCCRL